MTAKEFLKVHGIPNMPTQYSPQFQTDVNDTEKALEAYHEHKLKLLGIGSVVGQSELLKAFLQNLIDDCENSNAELWYCETAKELLKSL